MLNCCTICIVHDLDVMWNVIHHGRLEGRALKEFIEVRELADQF